MLTYLYRVIKRWKCGTCFCMIHAKCVHSKRFEKKIVKKHSILKKTWTIKFLFKILTKKVGKIAFKCQLNLVLISPVVIVLILSYRWRFIWFQHGQRKIYGKGNNLDKISAVMHCIWTKGLWLTPGPFKKGSLHLSLALNSSIIYFTVLTTVLHISKQFIKL